MTCPTASGLDHRGEIVNHGEWDSEGLVSTDWQVLGAGLIMASRPDISHGIVLSNFARIFPWDSSAFLGLELK